MNITLPTKVYKTSIDGTILWKLVSVLSLNYQTMTNKQSFLAVLQAYDFTLTEHDNISEKLRDAVKDIKSKTVYRITNGIAKKGTLCVIDIDDSLFYCTGEVYRLGLVLAKFFSSFASINSSYVISSFLFPSIKKISHAKTFLHTVIPINRCWMRRKMSPKILIIFYLALIQCYIYKNYYLSKIQ